MRALLLAGALAALALTGCAPEPSPQQLAAMTPRQRQLSAVIDAISDPLVSPEVRQMAIDRYRQLAGLPPQRSDVVIVRGGLEGN